MVDYSYKIIDQVKGAMDDRHVKIIIENSFQEENFKNINGFTAKRKLMMNTMMALRYVKAEGLDPKALQNIDTAIEVIEQLRKQEYDNLF